MLQVVFLVGQQVNSTHQEQLQSEADQYGDIVQEAFIDTYANLTVKSLMLLKWFTQHCDNTQYVMKADDDMYINLVKLYELVRANKKPQLLMGSLICNAIPIKVTSVLYCTVLYCTALYCTVTPSLSRTPTTSGMFPTTCSRPGDTQTIYQVLDTEYIDYYNIHISNVSCGRHGLPDGSQHGLCAVQRQPRHPAVPPGGHLRHGHPRQQSAHQVAAQCAVAFLNADTVQYSEKLFLNKLLPPAIVPFLMWSALVETTCLNKSASYNEYIVCSSQSSMRIPIIFLFYIIH